MNVATNEGAYADDHVARHHRIDSGNSGHFDLAVHFVLKSVTCGRHVLSRILDEGSNVGLYVVESAVCNLIDTRVDGDGRKLCQVVQSTVYQYVAFVAGGSQIFYLATHNDALQRGACKGALANALHLSDDNVGQRLLCIGNDRPSVYLANGPAIRLVLGVVCHSTASVCIVTNYGQAGGYVCDIRVHKGVVCHYLDVVGQGCRRAHVAQVATQECAFANGVDATHDLH